VSCCHAAAHLRFEELPISRLPGDASDPQLEAGLNRIHALDERLREADIKVGTHVCMLLAWKEGGGKPRVSSCIGNMGV
jgi:hypothetical protein